MSIPVLDKIAYSIPSFAKAVDLSVEKIRQHITRGELVPSYVDSKPLIMQEEGLRWLRARPAEAPVTERRS
jgi:hypothetical protein